MCNTAWCFGECDECIQDKKKEERYIDDSAQCPYKAKCNFETLDIKTDRCATCGEIFNY